MPYFSVHSFCMIWFRQSGTMHECSTPGAINATPISGYAVGLCRVFLSDCYLPMRWARMLASLSKRTDPLHFPILLSPIIEPSRDCSCTHVAYCYPTWVQGRPKSDYSTHSRPAKKSSSRCLTGPSDLCRKPPFGSL